MEINDTVRFEAHSSTPAWDWIAVFKDTETNEETTLPIVFWTIGILYTTQGSQKGYCTGMVQFQDGLLTSVNTIKGFIRYEKMEDEYDVIAEFDAPLN